MVINCLVVSILYYILITIKSKIFIIFLLIFTKQKQKIRGGDWLCELNKGD